MRPWIASLCLVAFCSTSALAQDASTSTTDPKIELAAKILQETHAIDTMGSVLDTVIPQMVHLVKQQFPSLTDDQLNMMSSMLLEEMKNRLPKMVIAYARIYANHFTLDELKAIEQFYETPAGQKMIAEGPAITKEAFPLGVALGREAAAEALPKVIEKMRAQGVKI
jgi:uncharacterized protein